MHLIREAFIIIRAPTSHVWSSTANTHRFQCWTSHFSRSLAHLRQEPRQVTFFNPLSPNMHLQILKTDLHTFPCRISWENLINDQSIFSLGDHFINSHNHFSWQYMDIVRRKLMLVTLGLRQAWQKCESSGLSKRQAGINLFLDWICHMLFIKYYYWFQELPNVRCISMCVAKGTALN